MLSKHMFESQSSDIDLKFNESSLLSTKVFWSGKIRFRESQSNLRTSFCSLCASSNTSVNAHASMQMIKRSVHKLAIKGIEKVVCFFILEGKKNRTHQTFSDKDIIYTERRRP